MCNIGSDMLHKYQCYVFELLVCHSLLDKGACRRGHEHTAAPWDATEVNTEGDKYWSKFRYGHGLFQCSAILDILPRLIYFWYFMQCG